MREQKIVLKYLYQSKKKCKLKAENEERLNTSYSVFKLKILYSSLF